MNYNNHCVTCDRESLEEVSNYQIALGVGGSVGRGTRLQWMLSSLQLYAEKKKGVEVSQGVVTQRAEMLSGASLSLTEESK